MLIPRAVTFIFCYILIGVSNLVAQKINPDSIFIKKANEHLQKFQSNGPGLVIGVIKDGEFILKNSYGYSNLEHQVPNDPQTVFHVASVSKQITAFCLLTLVDQGQVSVQDDIRKYIPELPDYGNVVTLHHLLTHTSGIREWQELLWLKNWDRNNLITFEKVLDCLKQQQRLNFIPGKKFMYSNSNYDLIAEVIRRVSKKSLNDFAQEFVFSPRKMTHCCYQEIRTQFIPKKATGYGVLNSSFQLSYYNDVVAGSAHFCTSVDDLYQWDQLFYSQDLDVRTKLSLMQTPVKLNDGTSQPYGYGLQLNKFHGFDFIEHSGSLASERAYIGRLPELKLSVIVLSNSSKVFPWQVAKEIIELYFNQNTIQDKVISDTKSRKERKNSPSNKFEKPDSLVYKKIKGVYKIGEASASIIDYKAGKLMVDGALELVPKTSSTFYLKINEALEYSFSDNAGKKSLIISRFGDILDKGEWIALNRSIPVLEEYLGKYYSEDLDMTYTVSKDEKGNLMVKKSKEETWSLRPTFSDAFQSEDVFIIFKRNPDKTASSFELNTYQTIGVTFRKVESK